MRWCDRKGQASGEECHSAITKQEIMIILAIALLLIIVKILVKTKQSFNFNLGGLFRGSF